MPLSLAVVLSLGVVPPLGDVPPPLVVVPPQPLFVREAESDSVVDTSYLRSPIDVVLPLDVEDKVDVFWLRVDALGFVVVAKLSDVTLVGVVVV